MNIVITGGNGFVGSALIPRILKSKFEVFQITTDLEKSKKIFGDEIVSFDYNNRSNEDLISSLNSFKPDYCIHLASYLTSLDDLNTVNKLLKVNIEFLCNILDVMKHTSIKGFINTGTFAEYFNGDGVIDPAYFYSATKSASRIFIDYYSKAYNFKQITVTPYTIYGGKDSQKKIIDIIYDSFFTNDFINMTPGSQVLDFIHLDDVVDFYITIINLFDKIPNQTNFNLGTGKGSTLKDVVSIFEKLLCMKPNINWGGKKYRNRDVMYAVANIEKQKEILGWSPKVKLNDGIKKYLFSKQ